MSKEEQRLASENTRLRALLTQAGLDAAQSEVATKLQTLLVAELHHRVKNMLAMIQALVVQTLRATKSTAYAAEAIQRRIQALARMQDLLLQGTSDTAPLDDVLSNAVAPFGSAGQFTIDVPAVDLPSNLALSISLVMNELSTNAMKYGALSRPGGKIALIGVIDTGSQTLNLTWTESGGPTVAKPRKRSFGRQLIEMAIPGTVQLEFLPAGAVCEIAIPLGALEEISN
jgi:two-component sensor histidine kinase